MYKIPLKSLMLVFAAFFLVIWLLYNSGALIKYRTSAVPVDESLSFKSTFPEKSNASSNLLGGALSDSHPCEVDMKIISPFQTEANSSKCSSEYDKLTYKDSASLRSLLEFLKVNNTIPFSTYSAKTLEYGKSYLECERLLESIGKICPHPRENYRFVKDIIYQEASRGSEDAYLEYQTLILSDSHVSLLDVEALQSISISPELRESANGTIRALMLQLEANFFFKNPTKVFDPGSLGAYLKVDEADDL